MVERPVDKRKKPGQGTRRKAEREAAEEQPIVKGFAKAFSAASTEETLDRVVRVEARVQACCSMLGMCITEMTNIAVELAKIGRTK